MNFSILLRIAKWRSRLLNKRSVYERDQMGPLSQNTHYLGSISYQPLFGSNSGNKPYPRGPISNHATENFTERDENTIISTSTPIQRGWGWKATELIFCHRFDSFHVSVRII